MKKIRNVVLATSLMMLMGCKNALDIDASNQGTEKPSNASIAAKYIENSEKIDRMCYARNLDAAYPEILYSLYIVDENDNELSFSSFTDEEKEAFYSFWKETEVNNLVEKLDENSSLAEMLLVENKAFEMTEENASRSLMENPEAFFERYQKNLQKVLPTDTFRAANGNMTITKDCYVTSSVNKMHANYKKGRLLVCTDSSSSSGSSFVGHASIMHNKKWEDSWNTNALGRATVTSYPKDKNAKWEGKTDGVQYEPIGIWAGNSSGSSKNVSIYNVGHGKWVWNWAKSHYEFENAPDTAYEAAADFAISQIGKGYNWNFGDKDMESKYYCSSLCYKAWRKQSSKYDVSMGFIASPANIASSHNTKSICSYSNY